MNDCRCPVDPRTLLAKVDGTAATVEIDCDPCKRRARQAGVPALLVLHTYDQDGVCTRTNTVQATSRRNTTSGRQPLAG